jgi:hypothetical protein
MRGLIHFWLPVIHISVSLMMFMYLIIQVVSFMVAPSPSITQYLVLLIQVNLWFWGFWIYGQKKVMEIVYLMKN